ncbi:MAG: 16S rRNA (adenine(1518)-N(6)/adenine(1519)-N(6))-dimethyltransferase RsmA [Arsenophonus sp. ET-YP4-MAG3]
MNKQIYQGHFARKRFGQNFLVDKFIINNIVTNFNPKYDQIIIEIGPGLGALTLAVSEYVKNMTVIELDRDLAVRLAVHPKLKSKLTIIQKDVMMIDFTMIAKEKGQPIRIFGNLPYNIATSLIFYLFTYVNIISDMNFMLQKEVANRLIAKPNTKEYGHFSIIAQYYFNITHILSVPASAFIPSPKVDSIVVRLAPYEQNNYPTCDVKLLNHITIQAFNQRRKTIRNSLKNLFNVQELEQLGINSNWRAENISIENYCKLAANLLK